VAILAFCIFIVAVVFLALALGYGLSLLTERNPHHDYQMSEQAHKSRQARRRRMIRCSRPRS
jgi:hypothetical protein